MVFQFSIIYKGGKAYINEAKFNKFIKSFLPTDNYEVEVLVEVVRIIKPIRFKKKNHKKEINIIKREDKKK